MLNWLNFKLRNISEEYKKLIERYAIFENASFNQKIADDDEFPAVLEAVKFYDKKAFGL